MPPPPGELHPGLMAGVLDACDLRQRCSQGVGVGGPWHPDGAGGAPGWHLKGLCVVDRALMGGLAGSGTPLIKLFILDVRGQAGVLSGEPPLQLRHRCPYPWYLLVDEGGG